MTFWLPLSFCCLFVGFLRHFSTKQGSSRRIFTVDEHVGIAVCGLLADGRQLVNRARDEAASYKEFYGCQIPGKVLAERLAGFVHAYTMYWSVRPFGSAVLIAGKDADGPFMWMVEPSGLTYNYFGCAIGKGKQPAKVEIEKLKLGEPDPLRVQGCSRVRPRRRTLPSESARSARLGSADGRRPASPQLEISFV